MSDAHGPVPEHPEAKTIRGQVEYYFSDDNLRGDRHLLEKCGGRENLPVSIKSIHGFPKMRQYKPYRAVVQALRSSKYLDVVDNKYIKRKIPLTGPTILDGVDGEDVSAEGEKREPKIVIKEVPQLRSYDKIRPQPKKNQPKGMTRPTGFEEYFADAPVTPAEAKDEEEMYWHGTNFENRIEIAIHYYKQRRKFHEEYAKIFNRWMKYGGIESGPMTYTGRVDDEEFLGRSKGDKALLLATHHAGFDKNPGVWEVDFVGVVKGFLSAHFLQMFPDANPVELKRATTIFRNFYNYLLHHDVCPEHDAAIREAREICDQAEWELPLVAAAQDLVPGDFNVACSVLFGEHYSKTSAGEAKAVSDAWKATGPGSMTTETARVTFLAGITANGSDELWERVEKEGDSFVKKITSASIGQIGLEVVEVHMPGETAREVADNQQQLFDNKVTVRALGKLVCRPWIVPDFAERDTTAGAAAARAFLANMSEARKQERREAGIRTWLKPQIDRSKRYEFWMEENVLQACPVGMKLEAKVRTLSIGTTYIDCLLGCWCSFYTYTANELVMATKWKEPIYYKSKDEIEKAARKAEAIAAARAAADDLD